MVETLYKYLFTALIIGFSVLIIFAIIKSILGPKIADRIVAVNVTSTLVVIIIGILSAMFPNEEYLDDVNILYVLISFVAVIVLANVFIGVNMRDKYKNVKDKKEED